MLKNIKNSFWYFLEQRLSKTLQWNELNCDCSDCSAVAALPPKGTHRVIILTTLEVSTSHKKLFRLFLMFTWKGQNRKCWIFWSVAVKGIFWGVPFQAGPKTLLQVSDRQSNVCLLVVVAVKKMFVVPLLRLFKPVVPHRQQYTLLHQPIFLWKSWHQANDL